MRRSSPLEAFQRLLYAVGSVTTLTTNVARAEDATHLSQCCGRIWAGRGSVFDMASLICSKIDAMLERKISKWVSESVVIHELVTGQPSWVQSTSQWNRPYKKESRRTISSQKIHTHRSSYYPRSCQYPYHFTGRIKRQTSSNMPSSTMNKRQQPWPYDSKERWGNWESRWEPNFEDKRIDPAI